MSIFIHYWGIIIIFLWNLTANYHLSNFCHFAFCIFHFAILQFLQICLFFLFYFIIHLFIILSLPSLTKHLLLPISTINNTIKSFCIICLINVKLILGKYFVWIQIVIRIIEENYHFSLKLSGKLSSKQFFLKCNWHNYVRNYILMTSDILSDSNEYI